MSEESEEVVAGATDNTDSVPVLDAIVDGDVLKSVPVTLSVEVGRTRMCTLLFVVCGLWFAICDL